MRLEPASSSLGRWLALPAVVLLVAGLATARFLPRLTASLAHCPLRDATGLACPTCGGTAAALDLAAGRWNAAWQANPLVPAGVVLVAAWAVWAIAAAFIPALRLQVRLGPGEAKAARILAALLLAGLWARQVIVLR